MEQRLIDKYFYIIFIFSLIFCILFYKVIGFPYTDELCAGVLFCLFFYSVIKSADWRFNKAFLVTLGVFTFYIIYSLWIGSNSPRGILNDVAIQLKPYLAFFGAYHLKPIFSKSRKRILREISLLFWLIFLLPIGIVSLAYGEKTFEPIIEHPAYYGIAVTLIAICYLQCSRFTLREKCIFLLLASIGIFSGRSKFYGFFVLSIFLVFFSNIISQFKWNVKNVLILSVMIGLVTLVAWNKISFYFFQVIVNADEAERDMMARFALYYVMPDILRDYFPFGSGFASFATYSSGEYYSDLYGHYGLDNIYGLSKSYHGFISDTFYPSLSQFGIAGILFFILFWGYIIRRAFKGYIESHDSKSLITVLLIIGFLTIESTTNSTFISQGGFFAMMLLGMTLSGLQGAPTRDK